VDLLRAGGYDPGMPRTTPTLTMLAVLLLLSAPRGATRADESPPARIDFVRDVRPIFQARCLGCHGPEKQRGGLRLDRKESVLAGGDSQKPAVVPGKSGDSQLIRLVTGTEAGMRMPPKGAPLPEAEIRLLRAWVDQGAAWPDTGKTTAEHWAFRPVVRPAPPEKKSEWVRNPIDAFVLARLDDARLTPAPDADRRTLLRRLHFDVVGLPPMPEDLDAFERDADPRAYERWVDRLLASPHFGERWARHWLDVVRFAESHGFEMNQPRPNAWRYRDWVIKAFNDNKPYDRFVLEQIAGDAFGADEATGFLVAGPWDQVKSPDAVLTAQQRADELHDMVSTTGTAFLGLTVGCARCHNHKFDPVTQTDYHAVKAVFSGVQHGERPLRSGNVVRDPKLRPAVSRGENVERFDPVEARFVRFTVTETTDAEPCLDELEVFTAGDEPRNVALAKHGARATASSSLPGSSIHKLEHVNDGRYGNDHSWISNERGRGTLTLELPKAERIDRVVWSRDRAATPRFDDRIATEYRIEVSHDGSAWTAVASSADRMPRKPAGPVVYAGRLTTPEETFRLHRGDVTQPRERIGPGVLAGVGPKAAIPADATEQQRRLALAKWIVDPNNPLTARVAVNRVWQYHFGEGIVSTPSDFGINGARPSHPELLDWLASELIARKWSLKEIHRLTLLSATYRQAGRPDAKGLAADAGSRLLWRFPPRRVEAEALRDAVLCVSGKLDRTAGGPGFDLFEPNTNYVKVYTPRKEFGPETFRRMIYQTKPRMQLDDTFGAFDCPDAGQIAPRRNRSTTPLQALNLLNGPFLVQQAGFFAERLRKEAGADVPRQVERGFLLALGRRPADEEARAAEALVREHGLAVFCRALFNANEFVHVR
jgi:mono/diheme cytochrome c family protein